MPTSFYWKMKYFLEEFLLHLFDQKHVSWPALSSEGAGEVIYPAKRN